MKTKPKKAKASKCHGPKGADRVIRENEIIKSDRIELIQLATRVAGMMISKQIAPLIRGDHPVEKPTLDATERQARVAALAFLARHSSEVF